MTTCEICHEPAIQIQNLNQKGFKGAKYTTKVFEHKDKECTLQLAFYPNYFGKGAQTKVHKWSTPKEPKSKEILGQTVTTETGSKVWVGSGFRA